MSLPILQTKLYIPPVQSTIVPRMRLLERLRDQDLHPLTLISAPAGFGKTTLVSAWVAQQASPVAWLALEEEDNDPTRFLTYLLAALQTCHSGIGESVLALLAIPQPPPLKKLLTLLLGELEKLTIPSLLIMDDLHVITAPVLHEGLTFLIDHLPKTLHLIITSRVDPPLPLARWRVRNQLCEIRAADLRFSNDEAAIFLNQRMELGLTPTEVALLETRTEGWIAGLQLAGLALQSLARQSQFSLQERRANADFIEHFSGSHLHIVDYLVEEVIQRQPERVRHFLLQTAILDRLCAELCEAVTGESGGQAMLEELQRDNLFLFPLDQERRWYRYHPLFATALRYLMQQKQSAELPPLFRRAAVWHLQADLLAEAVRYARVAQDWPLVADLVEQNGLAMLGRGEATTLQTWLAALPAAWVKSHPGLSLARAWVAILAAQYDTVEEALQQAEQALGAENRTLPTNSTAEEMSGQIAAARTLVAVHRHDPQRARQLGQQALHSVPEQNRTVRAMLLYAVGLAEWSSDNAAAARSAFAAVSRLVNSQENRMIVYSALNNLAGLQEVQGKLRTAAQTYRQALAVVSDGSVTSSPLAGIAYAGLGLLAYEWHEIPAAQEHLRRSIELSQRGGFEVSEALAWFGLALTYETQGARPQASEAQRRAEQVVENWQQGVPPVHISRYRAWLALLHNDWLTASAYCQEQREPASHLPTEWREADAIMRARIHLRQGKADMALALLNDLLPIAQHAERGWHLLEILLLQALCYQELGHPTHALTLLRRVLLLAEPEGHVHLFVDEGAGLVPLVRKLAVQGVAVTTIAKLLAILDPTHLQKTVSPSGLAALVEPLSERELEVLRLMATGLPNQAIAHELVVVLGTVKAHINHIYQKLGVENRVQALARARELQLL